MSSGTATERSETISGRAVFSEGDAARPITASQPPERACKTSKHYRSRLARPLLICRSGLRAHFVIGPNQRKLSSSTSPASGPSDKTISQIAITMPWGPTSHKQRGADFPAPFPFSQYPHAEGASDYRVPRRSCSARFNASIWNGFLRVGRSR